jgi:hypothetical protein
MMVRRLPIVLGVCLTVAAGCAKPLYDPSRATRPYPHELHTTNLIDIQVFRDGQDIELVNATPHTYSSVDVWINQRFVRRVDAIPAGETIRLSLWDFFDERGERMNAGGIWRTQEPTPVRLVQLQRGENEPMIGLITALVEPTD